jgi:hypothetical protein
MLMPGEHQPTLPALESLVPPELLNPAQQVAPPNLTPAERAVVSEDAPAPAVPVQPTTPFGTPPVTPVTPTTPFGTTPTPPPDQPLP